MFKFVKQLSNESNPTQKNAAPRLKTTQRWSSRKTWKDRSSEQGQNAAEFSKSTRAQGVSTPAQAAGSLTTLVPHGKGLAAEKSSALEAPRIGRSDAQAAAAAAAAAVDGDSSKPTDAGLLKALSANYLFKDLTTDVIYSLIGSMQHVNYGSKKRVLVEGSISDACYVLVQGSVDVLKHNKLVFTFVDNGIVGELGLASKCRSSATIRTKTKCTFLRLKRGDYQRVLCDTTPWRLPSTARSPKPLRQKLQSADLAARVVQRWARVRLKLKKERTYVGTWVARGRFYAPKMIDGGFQEGYVYYPAHPSAHLNADAVKAVEEAPATSYGAPQNLVNARTRSSTVPGPIQHATEVRSQTAQSSHRRRQEAKSGATQQSCENGGNEKKQTGTKRPLSAAAHFYPDQTMRRPFDKSRTVALPHSQADAVAELAELRRIPRERFDLFGYDVNRPARLNWLARRETKASESVQVTHAHKIDRADEFLRSEQRTRSLQESAEKESVKRAQEVAADASLAQEVAAATSISRRHVESVAAAVVARKVEDIVTLRQRDIAAEQFAKAAMAIEKSAAKEISRAKEVVAAVKIPCIKESLNAAIKTTDGNGRRPTNGTSRMMEDSDKDGINPRKRPSTVGKSCRPHRDEAGNGGIDNKVTRMRMMADVQDSRTSAAFISSSRDEDQKLDETTPLKKVTDHIAEDPPQPPSATAARRALEVAAAAEISCRAKEAVAEAARVAAAEESIRRRIEEAMAKSSAIRASKEAVERHTLVEAICDARHDLVHRSATSANNTPSNKITRMESSRGGVGTGDIAIPTLDQTLPLDTPQQKPRATEEKLNWSALGTNETRTRSQGGGAGKLSALGLTHGARETSSVGGAAKGSAPFPRSKSAAKFVQMGPRKRQFDRLPAVKRETTKIRASKDSTYLRATKGASTKRLEPKLRLIYDPVPVAASVPELQIDPLNKLSKTPRIKASAVQIHRTIRRPLGSKKEETGNLPPTTEVLTSQPILVVIHPVDERNCAELLDNIVRSIQCMVRQRASRNRIAERERELRIKGTIKDMVTLTMAPSAAAPNLPPSQDRIAIQNIGSPLSPTDTQDGRNSRARSSRGERRYAAACILQRNGRVYIAVKRHKNLVASRRGKHHLDSSVLVIQCMFRQRLARNHVRAADRRRLLLAAREAAEQYRKFQLRPEDLSASNARIKDTLFVSYTSGDALSRLPVDLLEVRHDAQSAQSKIGIRRRAAAGVVQQMVRRWSAVRRADSIRVSRRKEARRLKQYSPAARAVQRSWRQSEARRRVNIRRDAFTVCMPIMAEIIWSDVFLDVEKKAVNFAIMYSRAALAIQRQARIGIARNIVQKHQRNLAYTRQKRSTERRQRAEAREQQKRGRAKALEDELRKISDARKCDQAEQRMARVRQDKLHNLKVRMFDRDWQGAVATLQRTWKEKKRGREIEANLVSFLAKRLASRPTCAAIALQEAWRRRLEIRRFLESFISLVQYEKTMELAASLASNDRHTHREEAFAKLPTDTQKRYTVVVRAWRLQQSVRDNTVRDRLMLLRQQPLMEQEYYRIVMLRNEERRVEMLTVTHAVIKLQAMARRWRNYSLFLAYKKSLSSSRPGNEKLRTWSPGPFPSIKSAASAAQAQAMPRSASHDAHSSDRSTNQSTKPDFYMHVQLSTLRAQQSLLMETMQTLLKSQQGGLPSQGPAVWNNCENQHLLHLRDRPPQQQSPPLHSVSEHAAPYQRNRRAMNAPGYRSSPEMQQYSSIPNAQHPSQDGFPPRYGGAQMPTLFQRLEEARTRAAAERFDGKQSDDEGKRGELTSGSDGDDWVRNFDPESSHYYYTSERKRRSTWTAPKKDGTSTGGAQHHWSIPVEYEKATAADSPSYSSHSFRSRSTAQSRGRHDHDDQSRGRESLEERHRPSTSSPSSSSSECSGDLSDQSHSPYRSDTSGQTEAYHSACSSNRSPRGDENSTRSKNICEYSDSDNLSGRSDDMSRSMQCTSMHCSRSPKSYNDASSYSRKSPRDLPLSPSRLQADEILATD